MQNVIHRGSLNHFEGHLAARVESPRFSQRDRGSRRRSRALEPTACRRPADRSHANGLVLYTRNPDDFAGLGDLVLVVGI